MAERMIATMPTTACPMTRDEANAYISQNHRHSNPVTGHLFCIGAMVNDGDEYGEIVGIVIVGRPTARGLQDDWTCEVTRLCTTGREHVCSFLYAAAWRAARAMGYRKMVTYTLASESGASLRGAGWRVVAEVKPRSWHTPTRPRIDKHELQQRLRWEVTA